MLAHGDWTVYLDDDYVPERTWLEDLLSGVDVDPKPGAVAGTIVPAWPCKPHRWLRPDFHPYLSLCNYEGQEGSFWLSFPSHYALTAKSAYLRGLLLESGGSNLQPGRRGNGVLLRGEDTDLNSMMHKAGYGMWYCPKAVVHHAIPVQRLSKPFFRTRTYWAGRA